MRTLKSVELMQVAGGYESIDLGNYEINMDQSKKTSELYMITSFISSPMDEHFIGINGNIDSYLNDIYFIWV